MNAETTSSENSIARTVVVHLHYQDVWNELADAINQISPNRLLITSTGTPDSVAKIQAKFPYAEIFNVQNRGRDIYPLVFLSNLGKFDDESIVWKLHSKKSVHILRGDSWRRELMEAICGSKTRANSVATLLKGDEISMVGADRYLTILSDENLADHQNLFDLWNARLGSSLPLQDMPYVAGTIFACKSQVLSDLKKLQLKESDFFLESHRGNLFGKSYAIALLLMSYLQHLAFISRIRRRLDIKTRPASKETYALEAFLGQLARRYGTVNGVENLAS